MSDSVTNLVRSLLGGENFPECESSSLRLEKYVQFPERVRINGKMVDIHTKQEEIAAVKECHKRFAKPVPVVEPKGAIPFFAKLRSRLIVNQTGGILENAGICLHPHFGAPYIPGSALKGIARHAAWCEWKAETDESRKKDLAERIAETFGCPTQADDLDSELEKAGCSKQSGSVVFMAAYPCDKNGEATPATLAVDILTPHGRNDWTDPVPNPFLVVEKGTSFKFAVGPAKFDGAKHIDDAIQWLKKGLTGGGGGAKTSAGYGVFTIQGEHVSITTATKSYPLRLVSPAFLRGAEGDEGTLRESSLRGVLRYWWRILFRSVLSEVDVKALETKVWGGAGKPPDASQIVIRLIQTKQSAVVSFDKGAIARRLPAQFQSRSFDRRQNRNIVTAPGLAYASYGMDDSGRRRSVLHPGAEWRLEVSFRPRGDVSADILAIHAELALKALCTFGGVGSKSRKGFGSLDCGMELDIGESDFWNVMADALTPFGLALAPDKAGDYSFLSENRSDSLSVPLETCDAWAAVDRIGYAMQATATSYKHHREKAVAGLPRKIHGPDKRGALKHQHGRWAPPESLRPEGEILPKANRFASPLFVHVAPGENGNLKVNAIAFPSGLVRSIDDSREVLDAYLEDLQSILQETRWN